MWHGVRGMLLALALLVPGRPAAGSDRPWCLPPVFDGGERLHGLPAPSVFWLELLLRQHELCWRDVPGEVRILLIGSSSVYGFPFAAEETFAHRLNRQFDAAGTPAHIFNIAFVNPYQVRDAVILSEARRFAPDIVLYPVTAAEFIHMAPVLFPPVITFFDMNRAAVSRLAADPPAGLDEPFQTYASVLSRRQAQTSPLDYVRESGRLLRTRARLHARAMAEAAGSGVPPLVSESRARQTRYDCEKTRNEFATRYAGWQQWNILSYLEDLKRRDGIEAVVVYWPLAYEPVDDCYNVRYPRAAVAEFGVWLAEQTAARGLRYLDLHAQFPAELFLDSLHVSAEGHARLADVLAIALQPIIDARLEQCRATGSGCGS